MKNVLKKISAVAMAFTLLGAGTAVTKTVAPQSDNTMTAQAYIPPQYCDHNCGTHSTLLHSYKKGKYRVYEYAECCDKCGTPMYYWDYYKYVG